MGIGRPGWPRGWAPPQPRVAPAARAPRGPGPPLSSVPQGSSVQAGAAEGQYWCQLGTDAELPSCRAPLGPAVRGPVAVEDPGCPPARPHTRLSSRPSGRGGRPRSPAGAPTARRLVVAPPSPAPCIQQALSPSHNPTRPPEHSPRQLTCRSSLVDHSVCKVCRNRHRSWPRGTGQGCGEAACGGECLPRPGLLPRQWGFPQCPLGGFQLSSGSPDSHSRHSGPLVQVSGEACGTDPARGHPPIHGPLSGLWPLLRPNVVLASASLSSLCPVLLLASPTQAQVPKLLRCLLQSGAWGPGVGACSAQCCPGRQGSRSPSSWKSWCPQARSQVRAKEGRLSEKRHGCLLWAWERKPLLRPGLGTSSELPVATSAPWLPACWASPSVP